MHILHIMRWICGAGRIIMTFQIILSCKIINNDLSFQIKNAKIYWTQVVPCMQSDGMSSRCHVLCSALLQGPVLALVSVGNTYSRHDSQPSWADQAKWGLPVFSTSSR